MCTIHLTFACCHVRDRHHVYFFFNQEWGDLFTQIIQDLCPPDRGNLELTQRLWAQTKIGVARKKLSFFYKCTGGNTWDLRQDSDVCLSPDSFAILEDIFGRIANTLPETNIAPENRPSQKGISSSNHPFSGPMLVSGRVCGSSLSR